MDEIHIEPVETPEEFENVIELERYLMSLREKLYAVDIELSPIYQKKKFITKEIEQTKSKIKIADRQYWSKKQ